MYVYFEDALLAKPSCMTFDTVETYSLEETYKGVGRNNQILQQF
jgi:hypothetical protein